MQSLEQLLDGYLKRYLDPDFVLEQTLGGQIFPELAPEVCAQAIEEVLKPIRDLVLLPGKRWRPMLALLHIQHGLFVDRAVEGTEAVVPEFVLETIEPFGPAIALVELLHNATLIADDIEDNGKLRRGIPALHLSYGVDRALNSCNWCYFVASALLRPLMAWDRALALRLQSLSLECLNYVHLGQGLDIRWHREHAYVPTVEEYFAMATLKTGVLAGFAAELGCLCAQSVRHVRHVPHASLQGDDSGKSKQYSLWLRIGRAFQALDDLLNLTVGNPGKLRGDDLLEGKKSLPLCLFVHGTPDESTDFPKMQLHSTLKEKQQFLQQQILYIRRELEAGQEVQVVLEVVLAELLRQPDACAALQCSFLWLEAEFVACRVALEQVYQLALFATDAKTPAQNLLHFIEQLEAQLEQCRAFLAEHVKV